MESHFLVSSMEQLNDCAWNFAKINLGIMNVQFWKKGQLPYSFYPWLKNIHSVSHSLNIWADILCQALSYILKIPKWISRGPDLGKLTVVGRQTRKTVLTTLHDKYYNGIMNKELWERVSRCVWEVEKKGFSEEVAFKPALKRMALVLVKQRRGRKSLWFLV